MVFVLLWREARLSSGQMEETPIRWWKRDRTKHHQMLEALNGKQCFLQGYVTKIGSSTLREVMIYKNLLLQNLF